MGWFLQIAESLATALKLRKLPVERGERFTVFYAFLLLKQRVTAKLFHFLERGRSEREDRKQVAGLLSWSDRYMLTWGTVSMHINAFEQLAGWDTPYDELLMPGLHMAGSPQAAGPLMRC
jgi:hypothetical protein